VVNEFLFFGILIINTKSGGIAEIIINFNRTHSSYLFRMEINLEDRSDEDKIIEILRIEGILNCKIE
jgi:hypothetical protein